MYDIYFSLIVPIYKNEANIFELLERVESLFESLEKHMEVIFVIDGSPDRSYQLLCEQLAPYRFPVKLINLAKNYGSSLALKAGLLSARGTYMVAMSADLQEPAELIIKIFKSLKDESFDIVVGTRTGREDPFLSKVSAQLFWQFYNKLVQPDMPQGGIDVFGINTEAKKELLRLNEANSSMVGQIIWLGFRRKEIPYKRLERKIGKSSWTFRRKLRYMLDSIFSFTDLPIAVITFIGLAGLGFSIIMGGTVFLMWYLGNIPIRGYTTILIVNLFSLSLILSSIGVIGGYVWRAFENTKNRPLFIVMEYKKINWNS